MYSPHCSLDISYGTCWESLFEHQEISSLVIISVILMTCMFGHVVILKGEITCWSLLGVKGLTKDPCTPEQNHSSWSLEILSLWMKFSSVTIQMKAYKQTCGAVYYAVQGGSNF